MEKEKRKNRLLKKTLWKTTRKKKKKKPYLWDLQCVEGSRGEKEKKSTKK